MINSALQYAMKGYKKYGTRLTGDYGIENLTARWIGTAEAFSPTEEKTLPEVRKVAINVGSLRQSVSTLAS